MSQPIKYIAQLTDAPEVTLQGTADLDYWRTHLKDEGLYPHNVQGRAELAIGSVSSKFMAVRFTELSIAVNTSRQEDGSTRDGMYLIGAFNTSRLFSFIERRMFRTPYRHASVAIQTPPPACIRLTQGEALILHAERRDAAPAVETREEVWEGTIFLPGRQQFHARLAGLTEISPFTPSDVLALHPTQDYPAVQHLADSRFTATEWRIRHQAAHARSKTVRRGV